MLVLESYIPTQIKGIWLSSDSVGMVMMTMLAYSMTQLGVNKQTGTSCSGRCPCGGCIAICW